MAGNWQLHVTLKRNVIARNDIDHIVTTHLHGNHSGGLVFLILDAVIPAKRTKLVTITPAVSRQKLKDAIPLFSPRISKSMDNLTPEFIKYQFRQKHPE